MPPLYAIGYQGVCIETLLAALLQATVAIVLDIRERPSSHKPGFSGTQLAAVLHRRGIDYLHLKALGNPKPGRDAARAGRLVEYRRIFLAALETDAGHADLETAARIAAAKPACLLCYEHLPEGCHRSLVAPRIAAINGQRIEHLTPDSEG